MRSQAVPNRASNAPEAVASRAVRELARSGTPRRAAGAAAYFRTYEGLEFLGVDSATIRRLAANVHANAGEDWDLDAARSFAAALVARPELEAKLLGIVLLGRFRRQFDRSILTDARRWLERWCHDWATTDGLCSEVIGPLLVARPELRRVLRGWRRSRHLYVRRASAVGLINLARAGRELGEAYSAALALAEEDHHLLHKAVGWLLREAGKTDAARLERFLRRHGRRLSRTSVRYSIERLPAGKRATLLKLTRP
jgi:3-methyladenine DNA glycosylase AlkD